MGVHDEWEEYVTASKEIQSLRFEVDRLRDEQEQAASVIEGLRAEVERLSYRLASEQAMSRRSYGQS